MITTICIWIVKIATWLCHVFKREGSVFGGSLASKIDKKILHKIKYPNTVIAVTGSSGKGSTVQMIEHILSTAGKKIVWNRSESNVTNAIITTVLNNTSGLSHRVKADILLLEVDERHLKGLMKKGTITHLLITNITRDQPSRNISPEVIFNIIKDATDEKMHLIINADDPLLNRFKYIHKGKITTYGIDKNNYSLLTTPGYAIDHAYCPNCHTKLKYDAYHYGHLGLYKCPKCDFARGKVDYEAYDIDLNTPSFKIDNQKISLNKNIFFAVYYTLASYTVCKVLNLDEKKLVEILNNHMIAPRRGNNIYKLNDRKIEILEPKNENSLSYIQSLIYIASQKGTKSIVFGFEKVSRRYECKDLSWLWDINFELLKDESIDKIFCFGIYKYDIATRLYYAGISEDKILYTTEQSLVDDVESKSTGNIYALVGEDIKAKIRDMVKEESYEKEN